jgi:hypothetical protein
MKIQTGSYNICGVLQSCSPNFARTRNKNIKLFILCRIQRPKKMPDIDLSDLPEVEGAKKQWRSFIERNQSIVVQVRERHQWFA